MVDFVDELTTDRLKFDVNPILFSTRKQSSAHCFRANFFVDSENFHFIFFRGCIYTLGRSIFRLRGIIDKRTQYWCENFRQKFFRKCKLGFNAAIKSLSVRERILFAKETLLKIETRLKPVFRCFRHFPRVQYMPLPHALTQVPGMNFHGNGAREKSKKLLFN